MNANAVQSEGWRFNEKRKHKVYFVSLHKCNKKGCNQDRISKISNCLEHENVVRVLFRVVSSMLVSYRNTWALGNSASTRSATSLLIALRRDEIFLVLVA